MPALDNMQRTFSSKVMFILSATLFCCGVSLTVKYLSMPLSRHNCRKELLVYSPPLSEQSILIFLLVFFPMFFFHFTNNFKTFPLYFMVYTKHLLEYSSIKRHKVMVTSNRCHLGRSPDICVNIIQNSLDAMSCGAKSYLGLLSNDACSQNSNLQVLIPFSKPCFVKTCKDFSPVCPSLICKVEYDHCLNL